MAENRLARSRELEAVLSAALRRIWQKCEILETLRREQMRMYLLEQSRREQRVLDDLFLRQKQFRGMPAG